MQQCRESTYDGAATSIITDEKTKARKAWIGMLNRYLHRRGMARGLRDTISDDNEEHVPTNGNHSEVSQFEVNDHRHFIGMARFHTNCGHF
jgi:CTP synthase (UTP-ammonia lyase)